MLDSPDDALLASFSAGDENAGLIFIRRHQARVYGLARYIAGTALAEDIAQEAFFRVWQHAESYDSRKASVKTWLLTITRNLAIDALRVKVPQPFDPEIIIDLREDAILHQHEQANAYDNLHNQDLLTNALRELPSAQQRAVVLAALAGKTAREVSEIESIPLGTAKTRIRNGLHALQQLVIRAEHDMPQTDGR